MVGPLPHVVVALLPTRQVVAGVDVGPARAEGGIGTDEHADVVDLHAEFTGDSVGSVPASLPISAARGLSETGVIRVLRGRRQSSCARLAGNAAQAVVARNAVGEEDHLRRQVGLNRAVGVAERAVQSVLPVRRVVDGIDRRRVHARRCGAAVHIDLQVADIDFFEHVEVPGSRCVGSEDGGHPAELGQFELHGRSGERIDHRSDRRAYRCHVGRVGPVDRARVVDHHAEVASTAAAGRCQRLVERDGVGRQIGAALCATGTEADLVLSTAGSGHVATTIDRHHDALTVLVLERRIVRRNRCAASRVSGVEGLTDHHDPCRCCLTDDVVDADRRRVEIVEDGVGVTCRRRAVDADALDADHLILGADQDIAVRHLCLCRNSDATGTRYGPRPCEHEGVGPADVAARRTARCTR